MYSIIPYRIELWIVAALTAAICVIVAALLLEHLGGLAPCPLCYQQRYAYYAGIPALIAAYLAVNRELGLLTVVLLAAVCLAFLGNAGIGVYHAGVEWKLWAGPTTCSTVGGQFKPFTGNLLDSLKSTQVVRCDEAAWRLLGLSLAGWNVLASFLIAALVGIGLISRSGDTSQSRPKIASL